LLLRKAAQDEALLGEVLTSDQVSDEIIGFHCQQAVEKLLKALLPRDRGFYREMFPSLRVVDPAKP
jgi:HEPN domain-containing protein